MSQADSGIRIANKPGNQELWLARFRKFFPVLPVLALLAALAVHLLLPNRPVPKITSTYTFLVLGVLFIYLIFNIVSIWVANLRKKINNTAPIISVVILLVLIWDLVTLKLNLLDYRFFPNPDAVFNVFITDWHALGINLLYSLRLFFLGVSIGTVIGLIAGVAMGWNKTCSYWLHPLQRVIGAIPATAWLPIALVAAPTTLFASVFLVALATVFPVTVMTSTGVSNVKNTYFEVARTLGANHDYLIFRVAIPAALPTIFIGMFNAFCSAFLVLVVAEQAGIKAGIGWYMNFQVGMLQYQEMYACIILIALTFSGLITILFAVRSRMLVWQRGVIQW